MNQALPCQLEALNSAFGRMLESAPEHAPLISAMRHLYLARAEMAEGLFADYPGKLFETGRRAFSHGSPLTPKSKLPLPRPLINLIRKRLVEALNRGLPGLSAEFTALDKAFDSGKLKLMPRLKTYLGKGRIPDAQSLIRIGSNSDAADLYLSQIIKTLAEALGREAEKTADISGWKQGYCPICGSQAEIGGLLEEGNERVLCCSLCSSQWEYPRQVCPYCGCGESDRIELIYLDGNPRERAEACRECGRYVLGVERGMDAEEIPLALEPLRLVHLDMLAQERGFVPASLEEAARA